MGCVSRVYTDLAVIDITSEGLMVRDMAPGLTLEELQSITGVPLRAA
jgi:3-oxoadipate CoA-transferase beta subunit